MHENPRKFHGKGKLTLLPNWISVVLTTKLYPTEILTKPSKVSFWKWDYCVGWMHSVSAQIIHNQLGRCVIFSPSPFIEPRQFYLQQKLSFGTWYWRTKIQLCETRTKMNRGFDDTIMAFLPLSVTHSDLTRQTTHFQRNLY